MMSCVRRIIAITFAVAGTTGITHFRRPESIHAQSTEIAEFREGQVFPTIVFPSLDGNRPGSVADFRGKKLILHIFASW